MYFYFTCDYPAAIKLRGVYYGTVSDTAKLCLLEEPFPLTEICPLGASDGNFAFFPDGNFLTAPPAGVAVTDLKGGYLLRFFKRGTDAFRVVEQTKFRDAAITAFTENGFKISLETEHGFFAETLDFTPLSVNFTRGEGMNADLVFAVFACEKRKILRVYRVSEPALLLSCEIADFATTGTGFYTAEKLRDIAKHTIKREYAFSDGALKEKSREVSSDGNFRRELLPDKLIPYAFCEEFSAGGDYGFYLSDEIKKNADKLGGFFGDFLGVTTPPPFRDYREIGLVKKTGERTYAVDYFTFDVSDGKITGIKKI